MSEDSVARAEPSEAQRHVIADLYAAIEGRNADAAEEAINEAYAVGLHPAMTPSLISLAESSWHTRHEDVVQALQRLRPPDAVEVLERVAGTKPDYLAYDELDGLARKCTWALADIGTPEARASLERLAESPESNLTSYARRRLDNWDEERHRKGA